MQRKPTGPHRIRVDRRLKFSRASDRALRAHIFARDEYTCQQCGWRPDDHCIPAEYDGRHAIGWYPYPFAEHTLQVDHIIPFSLGGETREDNLQTLCAPCNQKKWVRA